MSLWGPELWGVTVTGSVFELITEGLPHPNFGPCTVVFFCPNLRSLKREQGGNPMKYLSLFLFSILGLCAAVQAENLAAATSPLPDAPSHRRFWTLENTVGFSVLGSLVAVDAITTQRGLNQGHREMNPVMRPFVTRGAAGEGVGSALGFGAALGTVYLLHRTHHYKAERITMRLMVGGESAVVVNNIVALH